MITASVIFITTVRFILFIAHATANHSSHSSSSDVIDQVTADGKVVLNKATISGIDVRVCSCDEQRICSEEMKNQAAICMEPCWSKFRQVTDRPEDLKACFMQKRQILGAFLTCFENNVESCVNTDSGPHIHKTNITELFRLGEKMFLTKKSDSITSAITAPIRKIIDAAGEFAICVKDCFLEKNHDGFCFDRFDCQPHIAATKAKRTIRRCTRSINWRKEAAEMCDCSVDAGLLELKDYCAMFQYMASKRRPNIRQGRH